MEFLKLNPCPIDPSVLVLQYKHRCTNIWNDEKFNAVVRCSRYDSPMYMVVGPRDSRVLDLLKISGFYGVAHLGKINLDHGLITALLERWRPGVHAFHFPFGEVGITLQDVEVLLGLKVNGHVVCGRTEQNKDVWLERCERLLGFRPDEKLVTRSLINVLAFRNAPTLRADSSDVEVKQCTRVLILQLLGGLLFPDTTKKFCRLYLLDLLEDLDKAGQYSWGSAVLAFLYRSLCRATDPQCKSLAGCLVLLQIWAWERLPMVRPRGVLPTEQMGDRPYGARWACAHKWSKVCKNVVITYRDQLDRTEESNFEWTPYPINKLPDYCRDGEAIWTVSVPLIFYYVVEHYFPERLCRQFGCVQDVPPMVIYNDTLHRIDGRAGNKDWRINHAIYVAQWDKRGQHPSSMEPWGVIRVTSNYSNWFHRIGRRVIGNPTHHPDEGYVQSAATVQALVHTIHEASLILQDAFQLGENSPILTLVYEKLRDGLLETGHDYVLELPRDDYNPRDEYNQEPEYNTVAVTRGRKRGPQPEH